MKPLALKSIAAAACAAAMLSASTLAQVPAQPAGKQPGTAERIGDPYPFDTCPVSGKKLGDMGAPQVVLYDGREVRFCCDACPEKFEKDKTAGLAKLDQRIMGDQRPLYPLKTSVVSGKELPPHHPYEFVYGNRLIRLADESEKPDFLKNPVSYLVQLDRAVISEQGAHYPLHTCVVTGDKLGEMGPPKDVVVAGRLIRLCCDECRKDIEEDPAKFITKVDAARHRGHEHPHGDHN